MARIPFPSPDDLSEETTTLLKRNGNLNVTRMMAHQPGLTKHYGRLGLEILKFGVLDQVLREAVILRVGILCDSPYEKHQHVSVARAVGMKEEMLSAILEQRHDKLDEKTRIALSVTDEIHANNRATAETIAQAAKLFSHAELVELCMVVGFYIMTAGYLNSLEVDIEDTPPLGETMRAGGKTVISRDPS